MRKERERDDEIVTYLWISRYILMVMVVELGGGCEVVPAVRIGVIRSDTSLSRLSSATYGRFGDANIFGRSGERDRWLGR